MNTTDQTVIEPASASRYRVGVIDDHSIMRAVFSAIVEDSPTMKLAWCAANLAQARSLLSREVPDLLIQDVSLPDGNGFDFTREVLTDHPHLRVLIISAEADETFAQRASASGARGFLSKDVSPEKVTSAISALCLASSD